MSTTEFDIEKYDRSVNFVIWQLKMKAMLVHNGYYKALEGVSKKPEIMTMEEWEEIDLKALSAIQFCLSNEILREVANETSALGLWMKLESLYKTKSISNRLLLKSRLHDLRLEEGNSLKPHLGEFFSILTDLQKINTSMDDEDLVVKLLCSLPPSYKQLRDTMIRNKNILSVKDVIHALIQRDMIESQVVKSGTPQNDILVVKDRFLENESANSGKNVNRHNICNYCHAKGHIKFKCWKLRKEKQSRDGKSEKEDDNIANANSRHKF